MAGDTSITIIGNLTADPELRFTPSGAAVANFTVASTPRRFDKATNEWVDQEALFLSCSVWRQAAENVAESLTKGMRVIVTGNLKARSYENREGEKRTVHEIDVDEVGPSMKYATAKVTKAARQGGGTPNDNPWDKSGAAGTPPSEPWSQSGGQSAAGGDPWATHGQGRPADEEPPF
jgi:single-strand DNA-binding protein